MIGVPYLARTGFDLQRDKLESLSERVQRPPQEQGRAGGGNRGKRRIRKLVILFVGRKLDATVLMNQVKCDRSQQP